MKHFQLAIGLLFFFSSCDSEDPAQKPVTWKTYTFNNSSLINDFVNCVTVDSDGHVWAGHFRGDVTEFDGANWIHHVTLDSGPFNNTITDMAVDRENRVWAGSELGLCYYKNGSWSYTLPPQRYVGVNISDIAIAPDSSIWICNPDLQRYVPSSGWIWYSGVANRIGVESIGYVWLGWSNGLSRYDEINSYITFTTANSGLPDNDITSILTGKNRRLFFGTRNGGLVKFNGVTWTVYNTSNSGLPSNRIQTLAFDHADRLWIGTDQGVVLYDSEQWIVYHTGNSSLTSNNITGIVEDKKGNIWISAYGGGLSVFNENGIK